MDAYQEKGALATYEQDESAKQHRWGPTVKELKLLLIASTGFFIDAYDLFIINLALPAISLVAFGTPSSSPTQISLSGGTFKAAANIGCVVGQLGFGLLSDIFGRKAVYGKEMMIIIIATIFIISPPSVGEHGFSGVDLFTWLTVWRVILGIGVGGDYPMSSSVVADRANLNRRGTMLAFIFSAQGAGQFACTIITLIILACFRTGIRDHGNYGQFNAVWRILFGIILVPCIVTLYNRLRLPESTKFKAVQQMRADKENKILNADDPKAALQARTAANPGATQGDGDDSAHSQDKDIEIAPESKPTPQETELTEGKDSKQVWYEKLGALNEFVEYYKEWRHLKLLIATAGCWFLLDITFYGISLNQSVVIDSVGLVDKNDEPFKYIWDNSIANLIITAAGFLPGYYVSMFTIEYIGRKWLQFGGFLLEALFLGIVAGAFDYLKEHSASFFACFALLQFFFNFGANMTCFVIPAEVFPTRVKGFSHGFSAACGKVGAIIAALGFGEASHHIGTDNTLWIFFGISIVGAALTLLLPETKGRDADIIDMEERREAHAKQLQ
ncbi:MFS general substrate transporter [Wallemia mellicola]|uniref:MFS general substrate transporter n=1 Tax=Wallemia mellicola TaxID=1708541 RepID=A0A4T0RI40_9BASI|nr:MFS general substrate transporter [Wallemia mellicola]TIB88987.1 MFS general substrate transporter [Wallemia mellicola]TIB89704.1 MFS general substrate transporter [Wallemia mellicola]TIC18444.1 MFS general substrate transporter [Wallemia mellicola]TIC19997.1 MFS general substrate transporter [Wallemia mellicola]